MITSKQAVLLDTDIGSDIDDALALIYLLRQPDCELVGITTVSGEPHRRARIADTLCRECGRDDVPIHVGVERPLLAAVHQPRAQQADALGVSAHTSYDNRATAVEYLRDTIRARPGEITLLAIGPLTNIGILFAIDPEIPTLLHRLVLMGGQHAGWAAGSKTVAEWNMLCDPHAAAIVFSSQAQITAIGFDITAQCAISADECRARFAGRGAPPSLLPMAEIWLRHASHAVFHDPLAAAVIFNPTLCQFQRGTIEVEHAAVRPGGLSYWRADPDARHSVATSVDASAFFTHYFDTVQFGDR